MIGEIKLRKISDLKKYNFVIPSYQRGYKWRQKDIEYLITDIAEISESDTSDYCLQPIVVASSNKDDEYILVDGQQRLSTIWLIRNWANINASNLKEEIKNYLISTEYDIFYDTRDDSNNFLEAIKNNTELPNKNTCDTHYFKEALRTIENNKEKLYRFFLNLEKNVKIIWYKIDSKDGPAHFERLNNAKISLTNAELVKAWLFTNADDSHKERIACEWDEMEYCLQNDTFFSFITTNNSSYNKDYNRIELLLDLYAQTKQTDKEQDEFSTFNTIVKQNGNAEEKWLTVQKIYNRLLSWYNDNYLFNMIGFLIEAKGDNKLVEIWNNCNGKNIKLFKEYIRREVIKLMPSDVEIQSMVYGNPKTKIVLLLFNILSLMSVNQKNGEFKYSFNDKFHFDLYKKENWDIEHVHATASQPPQKRTEWVQWLRDLNKKEVLTRLSENCTHNKDSIPSSESEIKLNKEEIIKWIDEAKNENVFEELNNNTGLFNNLEQDKFIYLYKTIIYALEGDDEEISPKQNSIGNLVLLNAYINRSSAYKVAPFSTKRRIIMEKVKNGSFVPLGTQNVFMKVYTANPGHFYKWWKDGQYDDNTKSDRDSYIDAIIETFNRIR